MGQQIKYYTAIRLTLLYRKQKLWHQHFCSNELSYFCEIFLDQQYPTIEARLEKHMFFKKILHGRQNYDKIFGENRNFDFIKILLLHGAKALRLRIYRNTDEQNIMHYFIV